ncbi:hypothetical protein BaRGS_00038403, partial [Batillaria attramentaria]
MHTETTFSSTKEDADRPYFVRRRLPSGREKRTQSLALTFPISLANGANVWEETGCSSQTLRCVIASGLRD